MTNPAIIEAATRALDTCIEGYQAVAVLAAVTPLIRAQVLEEAAKVAEEYDGRGIDENWAALACEDIAAAIRTLKEQP